MEKDASTQDKKTVDSPAETPVETPVSQSGGEKSDTSDSGKALRIALCILALALLLQGGYYIAVYLSHETAPGRYTTKRAGTVHALSADTPYIDTRIKIDGYRRSEVYHYFNEIALIDEGHDYRDTVRKWTSPIRFYAEGTVDDLVTEILQRLFNQMNAIEGFPGISMADNKEEANLIGYFYDDETFSTASLEYCSSKTASGLHYLYLDENDFSIRNGLLMVRNEMSDVRRRSVITEELVQAMGLQNDTYTYPDSLFYQGYNEVTEPNELDWILFRILYHPMIQSGMNYRQCFPFLVTIIEH